ncbi:MAG: DUF1553 domain-containing protein [Acidobacteriaceae bacterium]|nr:DUF1553 domain-containing protein [Acidobacteriaceae bacterium]
MFRFPVLLLALSSGGIAGANDPQVDFQRQVRPILSDKCFLCHGPDEGTRMADLRLDTKEGAFAKRKNGYPIVAGKPDESLLVKRIYSNDPAFRMPPVFSHRTLTDEQKDTLRHWIEQGAKWDQHWAFAAPKKVAAPQVKQTAWPRNEIDRFILAKIEANGLQPAPEADRRTLIRRVTLDLTGLPPTPAEVDAFVKDKSRDAYDKVVDRLLASPHYGEHRAHYWLDAARYADTNGLHFDNYREIWPYRDWVIQAFNQNMPFDRFTVEQLAGDLLPNATLDQKIASGFHRCNVTTDEGGVILPEVEAMYAKDRADTTGTVWMGLTVGCATCHDHKFDPISQKDYYSLTAFFRNTTQPIMDLNIQDTPPAVYVPPAQDRAKSERLHEERDAVMQSFSAERKKALADIGSWLEKAQQQARAYAPESQALALQVSGNATVAEPGEVQPVALPKEAEIVDGPSAATRAIQFKTRGKVALPATSDIDYDKPFTIATWIFIPDSKDDGAVASQLGAIPESGKGEPKHRGWTLRIDKGNLSLYDRAPSIYLMGADGKGISGHPAPEYKLRPNSWYHVVVAYDGSGLRRGINMYINGAPVTVVGRPEDIPRLTSSIKSSAPVTLGNEEKRYFERGVIADFRILNTMADPQEAELLYAASRAATAKKSADELSEPDAAALLTFFVYRIDPATAQPAAQLRRIDRELYAIRSRSATTLVMEERTDAQPVAHVLYRGQYDQMREEVHPNTPSVLPPMSESMPRNRLGLAMWIVDPANPLTARVTVNRFWEEIFGTGIVKTVEDFGSQGEPPSHPELLDWLALDFRDSGWNVKRFFKLLVTSATYRQSAVLTPEKLARDPQNRLIARGPRFRMDAEMVRDTALFASGLLRPEIGGPSVKPYQPARIWETVAMPQSNTRLYDQDTGDKLYRRSLYTFWKRAAPPPSMDILNATSRETCIVRRERTNTPLQALVTMNDVQFVEASRLLAQNAMKSQRRLQRELDYMAERLLARPLTKNEAGILTQSYKDFFAYYASAPEDASKLLKVGQSPADGALPKPRFAALTMVANEMLNLDEALVK